MAYKRVIVLGGGPIGLLCAIEAKQQGFREVYLIKKRPEYTRPNVPQLYPAVLNHIEGLVPGKIPFDRFNMGNVPFNKIESPLLSKAEILGVIVKRNFFADNIAPSSKELFGRYKSMTLTLKKWDQANKRVDETQTQTIKANLLIVATGRAAASDKLVTQVLGFGYSNLEPVNYMALGIFNRGSSNQAASDSESEAEDSAYEDALAVSKKIAKGGICFQTAEYDYLLSNLSGITKTDFAKIKQNQVYLRDLVIALRRTSVRSTGVREELMQVKNNLDSFEIKIQRAQLLISNKYPAVVVGDAAVTPHPDTGMGVTSGFAGFEILRTLMSALKKDKGHKEDDYEAYARFNADNEQHVSQKALEGTISICGNIIGLLKTYSIRLASLAPETEDPILVRVFKADVNLCEKLKTAFKSHKALAELYHENKTAWNNGPAALWNDLASLWKLVDYLTDQKEILEPQLKQLENIVGFKGDRQQ